MFHHDKLSRTFSHDSQLTVAVVTASIAVTLFTVYSFLRAGFGDPFWPMLKPLLIALFVLCFPAAVRLLCQRVLPNQPERWYTSSSFMSLVTLTVVSLAGALSLTTGINLGFIFYVLGTASFAVVFATWLKRGKVRYSYALLAGSVLFSIWVAGQVWGAGYRDPLLIEKLELGITPGSGYADTLFHTAISSMIATYGISTTGLDGIPYLAYHTGNHWLMAFLGSLLGLSALQSYLLAFPLILIPLFFSVFLTFVITIRHLMGWPEHSDLRQEGLFWTVAVVGVIGIVPYQLTLQLWSESFNLALLLAFLLFSLVLEFYRDSTSQTPRPWVENVVFLLFLAPALVGLAGFSKVSLVVLMPSLAFYLVIRLGLYQRPLYILSLIVIAALALGIYRIGHDPRAITSYSTGRPTHLFSGVEFLASVTEAPSTRIWALCYFFWVWLLISSTLYQNNILTFQDLIRSFVDRKTIPTELALVASLAGLAPSILLNIGWALHYFVSFQIYLSLGLLLSTVVLFQWNWRGINRLLSPSSRIHTGILLCTVAMLGIVLSQPIPATLQPIFDLARSNMIARVQLTGGDPSIGIKKAVWNSLQGESPSLFLGLQNRVEQLDTHSAISVLHNLNELPSVQKQETALYIPLSNEAYWSLAPCSTAPFIAPALSGVAMVGGIPTPSCNGFAFFIYDLSVPQPHYDSDLCARASRWGFMQVITISASSPAAQERVLNCP